MDRRVHRQRLFTVDRQSCQDLTRDPAGFVERKQSPDRLCHETQVVYRAGDILLEIRAAGTPVMEQTVITAEIVTCQARLSGYVIQNSACRLKRAPFPAGE